MAVSPIRTDSAIATHGLTKRYGQKTVLRDLTLAVPRGALFGFLGPNGTGKTTTIRILLGLLRATSGSAELLGRDAWRGGPRARAQVGYLPGDLRFYDWMSGRRMLAFLDAARGGGAGAEIARLARVFDLPLERRIRQYSHGMKQKLGLIQALMHKPALLILDEPTTALDPLVREAVYDELRAVHRDGRTVLFSSHTLSEVEALCDQVAILREGKLVECERIEVLQRRALRRVEIAFRTGAAPTDGFPAGLRVVHQRDGRLSARWLGEPEALLAWLAGQRVADVTIAPPDLEDLFLAYYAPQGEGGVR